MQDGNGFSFDVSLRERDGNEFISMGWDGTGYDFHSRVPLYPPPNAWFPGPTCPCPNGISVGSAILAQLVVVSNKHRHTDHFMLYPCMRCGLIF